MGLKLLYSRGIMASKNIIGVDLGGTNMRVARFDLASMEKQEELKGPTDASAGFAKVLDDIVALIAKLKNDETAAIGIGVPGLVSKGKLLKAPNIAKSGNIDVKKILEEKTGLPVSVGNDANCFALAEATLGSGKGHDIVVGITFGTGVGGGIVINGKIFEGAHGYAAELGHMLLKPGQPPYETADKRGEVEQFLSGTAMGKRCEEARTPEDYLHGAVCSFMQPDIYREVAWLCVNIHYFLDPDVIIFGGAAGHTLADHVDAIEQEMRQWTLPGTPLPKIVAAEIRDAGVIGAALLAK